MSYFNTINLESISIEYIEEFDIVSEHKVRCNCPNLARRIEESHGEKDYVANATYYINNLFSINNKLVYVHSKAKISYESDDIVWESNCRNLDSLINRVFTGSGWLIVHLKCLLAKRYNVDYTTIS